MSLMQIGQVGFVVYAAIGVIALLVLNHKSKEDWQSVWFFVVVVWPLLLGLALRRRFIWWRIRRTDPGNMERMMRLLQLREMQYSHDGVGTDFVYTVTYFDGEVVTFRVSEGEFIRCRRHPHLLAARKIMNHKVYR